MDKYERLKMELGSYKRTIESALELFQCYKPRESIEKTMLSGQKLAVEHLENFIKMLDNGKNI